MLAALAEKEALVWVAGTVTLPGTVMFGLLLERLTFDPPAGAAVVNVTVQVDVPEETTGEGEQLKELICIVTDRPTVAD